MPSKSLDELSFEDVMEYLQKKFNDLREENERLDKKLAELQKNKK